MTAAILRLLHVAFSAARAAASPKEGPTRLCNVAQAKQRAGTARAGAGPQHKPRAAAGKRVGVRRPEPTGGRAGGRSLRAAERVGGRSPRAGWITYSADGIVHGIVGLRVTWSRGGV